MIFLSYKNNTGFTLIELLVVVSLIGLLASMVLASVADTKRLARDTKRLEDMRQIRIALEMFYNDHGRYPGPRDGIPESPGNCIGIRKPIDNALRPYINPVPNDPLYDAGSCTRAELNAAHYYYAYDSEHYITKTNCSAIPTSDFIMGITFGFHTAEIMTGLRKDTCAGADHHLNTADYNQAIPF